MDTNITKLIPGKCCWNEYASFPIIFVIETWGELCSTGGVLEGDLIGELCVGNPDPVNNSSPNSLGKSSTYINKSSH